MFLMVKLILKDFFVENIPLDHIDFKRGLTHILTFTAIEKKIVLRTFRITI